MPFLHTFPTSKLIFIHPQLRLQKSLKYYSLKPSYKRFSFFDKYFSSPILEVTESNQSIKKISTDDLSILPKIEHDGPVILDIDLDFFCNIERSKSNSDLIVESINKKIDEIDHYIKTSPWKNYIKAITVAISPGFFPSHYWFKILPYLEELLLKYQS